MSVAAVSLAAGATAFLSHRRPPVLAPPLICPGGRELVAIAFARADATAAIGRLLLVSDTVLLVVGLTLFMLTARRLSGRWLAAFSSALALGVTRTFDPALGGVVVTGFAAGAAALFAPIAPLPATSGRASRTALVAVALAVCAFVDSQRTIPWAALAGLAGWWSAPSTGRRGRYGAIAAAGPLIAGGATVALMPAALSSDQTPAALACLIPPALAVAPAQSLAMLATLAHDAGPLVCALVLLGAVASRQLLRSPAAWLMALIGAVPLIFAGGADAPARALGMPLAVFWLLSAMGIAAIVRACRPNVGGRLAAAGFVVLTPLLCLANAGTVSSDAADIPRGHEQISLDAMRRLISGLPDGASLVREDAATDLLLRASADLRSRTGKSLSALPPDAVAIANRVGTRPVFALPSAQLRLQTRGFRLDDTPIMAGVARVETGGTCQTLTSAWRDVPELSREPAFALVARDPGDEGPFVAYVAFDEVPALAPHDWPATALRGFNVTTYTASPADRDRLTGDAQEDGAPADWAGRSQQLVVRFELWRTPDAPDALAIEMGRPAAAALARLTADAPQHLLICPAFPRAPGRLPAQ